MTHLSQFLSLDARCTLCGSNLHTFLEHDASSRYCVRPRILSPLGRPHEQTIEAYTDGEPRRAHAMAMLEKSRVGLFSVTPFSLREVCGPHVPWTTPTFGEPIATAISIESPVEAILVLAGWASWTFAHNAAQFR